MFRLPPSSIALSQNDVNSHLQQIDIYCGLLKQGFRKKEIIRYFHEQNPSLHGKQYLQDACNKSRLAPSTLSLSLRSRYASPSPSDAELSTDTSSMALGLQSHSVALPENIETTSVHEGRLTASASSTTDIGPNTHEHQGGSTSEQGLPRDRKCEYVPRQSSMLRFTQTVSPETSPSSRWRSLNISPHVDVKYRPRSETYSYEQSEFDASSSDTDQILNVSEDLEHLTMSDELLPVESSLRAISPASSALSPLAREFSPLQSSSVHAMTFPCDMGMTEMDGVHPYVRGRSDEIQSSQTPILVDWTLPEHGLSINANTSASSLLPSLPRSDAETQSWSEPASPCLPAIPSIRNRGQRLSQGTEHRQTQHQFFDGSFAVYNDELPPERQPQTPADIKQEHLTERSAAYTAPPGVIRSEIARRGHSITQHRRMSMEQSPTRRAMAMHERRHREFLRGAQIEALRIRRRRQHAQTPNMDSEQRTGDDELNLWRDELNADRVGEENFEESGSTAVLTHGMRIVSGNRRMAQA